MRSLATVVAVGAVAVLAGCGTPSADLFVVTRSGTIPGAGLTMLVGDGGTVRCNGGPERAITSADLIAARKVARELNGKDDQHPGPAVRDLALPAGPGSVLRYEVRLEKGSVAFSDTSANQTPAMYRAAKLVRDLARRVCGLPR